MDKVKCYIFKKINTLNYLYNIKIYIIIFHNIKHILKKWMFSLKDYNKLLINQKNKDNKQLLRYILYYILRINHS